MEPRGARDFSSPQIRVRGAGDFRQYTNQRLRLPNERPPLGPRFKRTIGALLALAIVGGIGVAVYFGVTLLIEEDDAPAAEVQESIGAAEDDGSGSDPATSAAADEAQTEQSSAVAQSTDRAAEDQSASTANESTVESDEQSESAASAQQTSQTQQSTVAISSIEPTVSEQQVTPAQVNGAEIVAERVTAEPVPSGIPRSLADGAVYDPSEPATVFTSRWPVGTTLRLTRLPGATVLTDEEQEQVVGLVAMVVVRGSESSNTDLQLSPAAFEQIAFYGTERIIAVRVEVTAAPP